MWRWRVPSDPYLPPPSLPEGRPVPSTAHQRTATTSCRGKAGRASWREKELNRPFKVFNCYQFPTQRHLQQKGSERERERERERETDRLVTNYNHIKQITSFLLYCRTFILILDDLSNVVIPNVLAELMTTLTYHGAGHPMWISDVFGRDGSLLYPCGQYYLHPQCYFITTQTRARYIIR